MLNHLALLFIELVLAPFLVVNCLRKTFAVKKVSKTYLVNCYDCRSFFQGEFELWRRPTPFQVTQRIFVSTRSSCVLALFATSVTQDELELASKMRRQDWQEVIRRTTHLNAQLAFLRTVKLTLQCMKPRTCLRNSSAVVMLCGRSLPAIRFRPPQGYALYFITKGYL